MSFDKLGLDADILSAIAQKGYTSPTPIQEKAIPYIIAGRDLEGLAQTGTGKTAAFVLPILHRLLQSEKTDGEQQIQPEGDSFESFNRRENTRKNHHKDFTKLSRTPKVLILVPTRELAAQVLESTRDYGKHTPFKSLAVYGGVSLTPQITALRRGVDILVATPGRLLDHIKNQHVNLNKVQTLVLDEADRMFDMGFINDIRKIIGRVPRNRQNLLFTATFAPEVRELAHAILHNPALVEVARRNTATNTVEQSVIHCDQGQKRSLLIHLFKKEGFQQTLIFCRTKHGSDALTKGLNATKITAVAIHGNKSQKARTQALQDFKDSKVEILVATDIASRGLDINALPLVVNYELPHVPEDYVHRIGRTGRAGSTGKAISLVCSEEASRLREIEKLIKKDLPISKIEGFEPKQSLSPPKATKAFKFAKSKSVKNRSPTGRNGSNSNNSNSRNNNSRTGEGGKTKHWHNGSKSTKGSPKRSDNPNRTSTRSSEGKSFNSNAPRGKSANSANRGNSGNSRGYNKGGF